MPLSLLATAVDDSLGPGSLVPIRIIHQFESPIDITPVPTGDFDADGKVTFSDLRRFQYCLIGLMVEQEGFIELKIGCGVLDLNTEGDSYGAVDLDDYARLRDLLESP